MSDPLKFPCSSKRLKFPLPDGVFPLPKIRKQKPPEEGNEQASVQNAEAAMASVDYVPRKPKVVRKIRIESVASIEPKWLNCKKASCENRWVCRIHDDAALDILNEERKKQKLLMRRCPFRNAPKCFGRNVKSFEQ